MTSYVVFGCGLAGDGAMVVYVGTNRDEALRAKSEHNSPEDDFYCQCQSWYEGSLVSTF